MNRAAVVASAAFLSMSATAFAYVHDRDGWRHHDRDYKVWTERNHRAREERRERAERLRSLLEARDRDNDEQDAVSLIGDTWSVAVAPSVDPTPQPPQPSSPPPASPAPLSLSSPPALVAAPKLLAVSPNLVSPPPLVTVPGISGVHMLDQTGCQDFSPGSYFNRQVTNVPPAQNSAQLIATAMSEWRGGIGVAGPYLYAVVPASQPMTPISGSAHSIPPFPLPANAASLVNTGDRNMLLVQKTSPCTAWEGYSFSPGWSGYSGGSVSMGDDVGDYICTGVANQCGEQTAANLTYYEASAGIPILHAIHMEIPSPPNCDGYSGGSCFSIRGRLRLRADFQIPSDKSAAYLVQALQLFGGTTDDNGQSWNVYGMRTVDQPNSFPQPVQDVLASMRFSDFVWLIPGSF